MMMVLMRLGPFGPVCRCRSTTALIIFTIFVLEFPSSTLGRLARHIRARFWGCIVDIFPLRQRCVCKGHG